MSRPLRVGITCYSTIGGSGIVATEIGLALAKAGHQVHFICSSAPWRLSPATPNVGFHPVETPEYPTVAQSAYVLALCSKMVEVAERESLDLLHVHYAIPHAPAGYLAQQILGARAPRLITTLHGTDITVVGNDPSFLPVTRFAVQHSDGVTVPSRYLQDTTRRTLGLAEDFGIEVIPNFVDTDLYRPAGNTRARPLLVHGSNFRRVKRVEDVVRIFARVRKSRDCSLALIGDGPERARIAALVDELGVANDVTFLGNRLDFVDVLQEARVFLLPSESEGFGLAALEALSCGVPVVGSRAGGLVEVVDDGATGYLCDVGDVDAMAQAVDRLLADDALFATMSAAARQAVLARFRLEPLVRRYEAFYRKVLAR